MTLLAVVIIGTVVGSVVEAGVGAAVEAGQGEGGSGGSITEDQKAAAEKAKPDIEACYNTRDELQSKYPEFETSVKSAVESMWDAVNAATGSGDSSDVLASINKVTKEFQHCVEFEKANPATIPVPDTLPPAKQNFRVAVASYHDFLKTFPGAEKK